MVQWFDLDAIIIFCVKVCENVKVNFFFMPHTFSRTQLIISSYLGKKSLAFLFPSLYRHSMHTHINAEGRGHYPHFQSREHAVRVIVVNKLHYFVTAQDLQK